MSCIDLHMHSLHSDDGEFTPEALMERCRKNGVHTAALTDHNSTAGVAAARSHADTLGITLIPGIELDCLCGDTHLHVLGYFIDPEYKPFWEISADLTAQEQAAALKRIRLVQEYGIFVDEAEVMRLARNGIVPGELIAEVAMEDPRNRHNPKMAPYLPGGEYSDRNPMVAFYWNLCAGGKPAYVPTDFITLEQAVAHIRAAGGVPVLAHPGNNIHEDEALLHRITAAGVPGIEAFSSYHSPEQTAFYNDMAARMDLAVTCGSDFHGKTKPSIEIGCVDCGGRESRIIDDLRKRCRH